jgi:hypothetical protein
MQVSVRGARDHTLTQLLKLAAKSFGKNLFSPRMLETITIKIRIHDTLDAGGYCDYEVDDETLTPRTFIIDILRTRRKINMFKVLAHEMVHAKQTAKGEMKDRIVKSKYVTLWFGEKYTEDVSYWDHPWELEAYGLEHSLVAKFLIEHDQFKNLRQKHEDWFAKEESSEE